ncbi:hypothetical protein COCC4DRAFT_31081 [Bipolaris maydis ATCC 48331]|uniref:O-methyltransferase domain-containing protein n=2 Tax=Cochliobolus heterostrophus TaxID=5016 RepID=M2V1L4_COCH5|nr:uncharacterized protein COCC4DRAFT_31081 [Bipolaris maydis ATCC 48331]EMD93908.1 hypothetical protein COCHEDRAFT_1020091 [Bipolaris maydis C5]KAJ5026875.1 hypothetical protein J3E73DRAFT_309938 [Bipolaris maydis]ENI07788.1 hypothetical protein COCC4DRAFT_31081 [Bipolaris maydis ATCC 48331]KAJ5042577.1 toxin biosynthesis regulatory protein AflJ [Bipolaris maydis]KAJ5059384.1 toxin biosynthesis regulatory protein AflJ [Bipolaris maydis]
MDLSQLDTLCSELALTAKRLKALCESNNQATIAVTKEPTTDVLVPPARAENIEHEIALAHSSLSGISSRLETLLAGPASFIQSLATQNQLLACLKWMGEYQIIAYIPLDDTISLEELANLADVPERTLSRVVRMTATAGFLYEPKHGHVAHTSLSLSFTTELSYFDAAMFLASKVAPASLDLTSFANEQDGSAAGLQSSRLLEFVSQEPQTNRQWQAYRQSMGSMSYQLAYLPNLLNWRSLGDACVVDICDNDTSLARDLAQTAPALRLTVQTYDFTPTDAGLSGVGNGDKDLVTSERIIIQRRKPTAVQPVKDAAVYLLHTSFCAASTRGYTAEDLITMELKAHFGILRANPMALLILAPAMLPEPGSVAINVETRVRLLDFTDMHLTGNGAMEVSELYKLTESISDARGKLVVKNRVRSADGATIALVAKYQSCENGELI